MRPTEAVQWPLWASVSSPEEFKLHPVFAINCKCCSNTFVGLAEAHRDQLQPLWAKGSGHDQNKDPVHSEAPSDPEVLHHFQVTGLSGSRAYSVTHCPVNHFYLDVMGTFPMFLFFPLGGRTRNITQVWEVYYGSSWRREMGNKETYQVTLLVLLFNFWLYKWRALNMASAAPPFWPYSKHPSHPPAQVPARSGTFGEYTLDTLPLRLTVSFPLGPHFPFLFARFFFSTAALLTLPLLFLLVSSISTHPSLSDLSLTLKSTTSPWPCPSVYSHLEFLALSKVPPPMTSGSLLGCHNPQFAAASYCHTAGLHTGAKIPSQSLSK